MTTSEVSEPPRAALSRRAAWRARGLVWLAWTVFGLLIGLQNYLFTNFRGTVNPQTVLFLGYSDNYLGQRDFDALQTDRTFFMKIGYAWRL